MALSSDGFVYVWGSNSEGALGLGDEASQPGSKLSSDCAVPTKIDEGFFEGKKIVKIAAGLYYSAVVTEDGRLYTL